MTTPFSPDPLADPPPLGDDIEERTRRRIRRLLARRHVTAVGLGAGFVALVLVAALMVHSSGRQPETLRSIDHAAVTMTSRPATSTSTPSTAAHTGSDTSSTSARHVAPSTTAAGHRSGSAPARVGAAGNDGSGSAASPGGTAAVPGTRPDGQTVPTAPPAVDPPTTAPAFQCPTGGTLTVVVTLTATPGGTAGTWVVSGTARITNPTGAPVATLGWVNPTGATVVGSGGPLTIGWQGTGQGPTTDAGDDWIWVPAHDSLTVDLQALGDPTVQSAQAPTSFTVGGRYASWGHPQNLCDGLDVTVTDGH